MATKNGADGPSILRSRATWIAVSAAAAVGQDNARPTARPGRAANRASRAKLVMAMPGSFSTCSALGAADFADFRPRSDKEHDALKGKRNLRCDGVNSREL